MVRWPWLAGLLVAGAVMAETDAARWRQLLQRSPFAVEQMRPAAPIEVTTVQFRGYVVERDTILFNLHLPALRKSIWLALGETDAGLAVRNYDPTAEALTVEYQGQTYALTLRHSKIIDSGAVQANGPTDTATDLVPPRYIRNGLRNRSLTREEVAPHMDNDWFRDFVRQYGPPVYRTDS